MSLDDGACIGHCNDRYRRAWADYDRAVAAYDPLDPDTSRPDMPDIRPYPGRPWCMECASAIRLQLSQLDTLAALRRLEGLGADGYAADAGAERVSGSREQSSPSPSADDADDTYRMLAGWEQTYRELRGMPSAPHRGDLADRRTECIAWLTERLDAILASDVGEYIGAEILTWHADLKAKTKAGVRTLKKPLRCPACRHLLMKWTEGEKDVRCYNPDCGVILSLARYEAIVDSVAEGIRKNGITAEERENAQAGALAGA